MRGILFYADPLGWIMSFMFRLWIVLVVTFCLLSVSTRPRAQEAAEKTPVQSVSIKGLQTLSPRQVREFLTVERISLKPWVAAKPFGPEDLEKDIQRLRRYLEQEGFYDPDIGYEWNVDPHTLRADVILTISEGVPTLVQEVLVEGLENVSESVRDALEHTVGMFPGKRFRLEDYLQSERGIRTILVNNGYPRAQVTGRVRLRRAEGLAVVRFLVTPGREYAFGPVHIQGAHPDDENTIRSRLTFEPGGLYDQSKVNETQRKVFDLGPFNVVTLRPQYPPVDTNRLPMILEVAYRRPRTIKLGIGYGTEDRFRTQAVWTHRNFLQQARRLDLSAKYSYRVQGLESSLIQPVFFHPDQAAGDHFGIRRERHASFTNRMVFNRVHVTRNLTPIYYVSLGHGLELNRVENVEIIQEPEPVKERSNFIISMIEAALGRDTRDDVLNPTQGSFWQCSAGWASSWTGSEVDFVRLVLEGRHFQPLGKHLLLAGRILAGVIEPTENTESIPVFRRFFSGGTESVRGYPYQNLGPKDSQGNPLGGLSLFEGSLETRFPLFREFGGVIFLDFGNVDESAFSMDFGSLRYSTGFGLRYGTPIGPVRFDLGYQLNPQDEDAGRVHLHFSIGQAF